MKTFKNIVSLLCAAVVFSFLSSCNKKNDNLSFQNVFENGGIFEDPMNSTTKSITVDTVVDGDSLWACSTETYSIIQGLQEFPLFNPNSSVIYPGNLLQGGSLKNASPDVIVVDRAAGTFSIDIVSGAWSNSAYVDEVVKSKVVQAMNDIIYGSSSSIPANISFSMQEVHSEQQMALALGVDFTAYGTALQGNLGFSSNSNYNRVLVKLSQSYYTMSFDLPASYDDLFAPTVTPQDLQQYVTPGNPACYISDVTYGRVFYLLVESTSSSSNITSSINASFAALPNSPSANVNASYLSNLENLNIKLFALGGDASTTLYTISSANVNNLVSVLGAAGDITTGVPLSYVCRAVNGNNIVSVNLATSYDVQFCEPIGPIVGDYGSLPSPVLNLDASDANTSNNGIINYVTGTNIESNRYEVGNTYGSNVGGRVVENWPDANGINVASSSDPNNRPVYVNSAVNGHPAIEFCSFEADGYGSSSTYDQNISTSLEIPGGLFTNTNYTLFIVASSPTKLTVRGDQINNISSQAIDAGTFMQGADDIAHSQLTVGFNSNSNLIFGHNDNDLDVPVSRSSDFRVMTFRFSTQEGMQAFINENNMIANDQNLNIPLTSNNGLMLNSVNLNDPTEGSRSLIAELKLFDVALNDADRRKVALKLMQKYNL
tara:strand:- start:47 stop:2023 length:1977 start_codon:yes stop_codon:yes gene_type:complete